MSIKMTEDYRRLFFEMIPIVAENRHFKDAYAIETFLYLYEMHKDQAEGVITAENMTEEEKDIARRHFSTFMYNTGICFLGTYDKHPREILSAIVVFRIEVAPVLATFVPEEHERRVRHMLSFYAEKEAYALRLIEYHSQSDPPTLAAPDGSHALHKHPWWKGNFSHEPESVSNYELED